MTNVVSLSESPVTIHDAAHLALMAERKADIAELLDELHSIMPIIKRHVEEKSSADASISQHPVVRLYVDQMHHITHKCLNGHALEKHLKAVQECKKLAEDFVHEGQLAFQELGTSNEPNARTPAANRAWTGYRDAIRHGNRI